MVQVALADGEIDGDISDAIQWKLGGRPVWIKCGEWQNTPTVMKCKCGRALYLITQIFAPAGRRDWRVLYVFACNRRECSGTNQGWKILRITVHEPTLQPLPEAPVGDLFTEDDFNVDDTEIESLFNKRTDGIKESNELVNSLGDLSMQERVISVVDNEWPVAFPAHYLYVMEEPKVSANKELEHAAHLFKEYSRQHDDALCLGRNQDSEWSEEKYEKAVKPSDKFLHRFQNRVQQCPGQCLRYAYNEAELWFAPPVAQQTSHCPSCGSRRVFEMQLMPALLDVLNVESYCVDETVDSTHCNKIPAWWQTKAMEFGTVLIYTCAADCRSGYVEEFCIVQTE